MPSFIPSPVFGPDQIFSAEGHFNTLLNNVNYLYDLHHRWHAGFPVYIIGSNERSNSVYAPDPTDIPTTQLLDFFERGWHYNSDDAHYEGYYLVLERGYRMVLPDFYIDYFLGGEVVDDVKIKWFKPNPDHDPDDWDAEPFELEYIWQSGSTSGSGMFQWTWDLTSLPGIGLQPGDFYRIEVWVNKDHDETNNRFGIYNAYEGYQSGQPVFQTMRDFDSADCVANGIPTVEEWNALSFNVDLLEASMTEPAGGYTGLNSKETSETTWRHVSRTRVEKRSGQLFYHLESSKGLQERDLELYLADGDSITEWILHVDVPVGDDTVESTGTIDMSSYTSTTDYWEIIVASQVDVRVIALFEDPTGTANEVAWNVLDPMEHWQAIDGDNDIALLRDNIQWLVDNMTYENRGSAKWYRHNTKNRLTTFGATEPHRFIRRYRFLHYRYDPVGEHANDEEDWYDDQSPEIAYMVKDEEETASLDVDDNERPGWYTVDLDSVRGLHVGMEYTVRGCSFAFEERISVTQGATLSA